MLIKRVITALLLAPLVVLAVFKLNDTYFSWATAFVVLLGAWELGRIAGLARPVALATYTLVLGGLMVGLVSINNSAVVGGFYIAVSCWWVLFLVLALSGQPNSEPGSGRRVSALVGGAILLLASWGALNALHALPSVGPGLLMFLLLLIWAADISAYFSGRAFGRTKLSPSISPGKTWEGVYGALLGALVCGLVLHYSEWLGMFELLWILPLCVATALISVGGDLWESLLKRRAGMKDSGNILPGHGGILDRIDSLIAAAPFFIAGLGLMGLVTW